MSNEHLGTAPESVEVKKSELEAASHEQLAAISKELAEKDPGQQAEKQANENLEQARKIIDRQEPDATTTQTESESKVSARPLAFLDHHLNYSQTLASVQRKLSPASRSFSKVIHAPIVEKTSEALETTIARPSLLLGATWTALIVGSIFYLTARHYDYALSGSELLFSFIVGAIIGILLESIWHLVRRK